jgi:hypothetical protein
VSYELYEEGWMASSGVMEIDPSFLSKDFQKKVVKQMEAIILQRVSKEVPEPVAKFTHEELEEFSGVVVGKSPEEVVASKVPEEKVR